MYRKHLFVCQGQRFKGDATAAKHGVVGLSKVMILTHQIYASAKFVPSEIPMVDRFSAKKAEKMNKKKSEQYVCLVCGYNIIGSYPDECPFCGAARNNFITSEECSARFKIKSTPVNEKVFRLNSQPALGLEHAAYRIETDKGACWIDCPSSFDSSLEFADTIMFTHHHFLGASNLYRDLFGADVRIHNKDSWHKISRPFTFDTTFNNNFVHQGIEAFHINGHTTGFTFYIFEDILFICDYVFLDGKTIKYNPFGPVDRTIAGGHKIREIISGRKLSKVCGYNYVTDFKDWIDLFNKGPIFSGF